MKIKWRETGSWLIGRIVWRNRPNKANNPWKGEAHTHSGTQDNELVG